MSVEAQAVADRIELKQRPERRESPGDRRGRERRRPGSRINNNAPRQSILKFVGVFGVLFSVAAGLLTLLGGEMLDLPATVVVVGFEVAGLMTSVLLLAIGSIELRLVEIRLELMMLNGGMRGADRRATDRRGESEENQTPSDRPLTRQKT